MRTDIERQVMASVGVIYAARTLASVTALKLYVLAFSAAGIAAFVSVPNVLQNFQAVIANGPDTAVFFVVSAILGTTLVVQCALAMGAVAALSLLVSGVRSVLGGRRAAFA